MKISEIPVCLLREAPWNPNIIDAPMTARLRGSIKRYGLVQNLVVRRLGEDTYEVIGGHKRLNELRELGHETAPCVIVDLEDADARLLGQALNSIHGEDDLGLKAEAMREILEKLSPEEVIVVLPETAGSLKALSDLGRETVAGYLANWQRAQKARLRHLQFQVTAEQLGVVDKALARVRLPSYGVPRDNPNRRGEALYRLCLEYLDQREKG